MKFIIRKTSGEGQKPCKGAKLIGLVPKGALSKDTWPNWVMTISSLPKLIEFQKKYKSIVISNSLFKEIPTIIGIYDTYRE